MKILLIIAILLSPSFAKSDKYSCPTEIVKLSTRLAALYTNFQFGQILSLINNIISIWEKVWEIQSNCPASEFNEFLVEKSDLFLNLIKMTYDVALGHYDDLKGHAHEQLSQLQEQLQNMIPKIPGIIGSIASQIPEQMKQAYTYTKEVTPIVYDIVERKLSDVLSKIYDLF